MNKTLMRKVGLNKEVDLVEMGSCPTCEQEKAEQTIKNLQSLKEFRISGMCQKCQDATFGKEDNPILIPSDSFCYIYPPRNIDWGTNKEHTHKKYIGKSGRTWIVANVENAGADIHVSDPNPNSQGYGGSSLKFLLEDGSFEELQGPWHANSDALYADTGVDVRDKHLTIGVISKNRKDGFLIGILYLETVPELGVFDRTNKIAQKLANMHKKTLYLYCRSSGGSSCGPIEPEKGE